MRAYAADRGVAIAVRRFPAGTRTAQDAARAIGVGVGQIVKSLVFLAGADPVLVLCCGDDRVSEERLRGTIGVAGVRRANADEAKAATGHAIGGVPPFGHTAAIRTIMDEGMFRFASVWAAAGLPDAVFEIAPDDLLRLSGAQRAAIAERL